MQITYKIAFRTGALRPAVRNMLRASGKNFPRMPPDEICGLSAFIFASRTLYLHPV